MRSDGHHSYCFNRPCGELFLPGRQKRSFVDLDATYAFPLPSSFFSSAVLQCSALLCFRVRHEIPSLGTWGRGREGRRGREQGRRKGVGGRRGSERESTHICCRPRKNVDDDDELYYGGNRQCNCYIIGKSEITALDLLSSPKRTVG